MEEPATYNGHPSVAPDQELQSAVDEVLAELARARKAWPKWPQDPLHAAAVIGEELGELTQAVLETIYEPGKTRPERVREEAVQVAAMAVRFVSNLDRYAYRPSVQYQDTSRQVGA